MKVDVFPRFAGLFIEQKTEKMCIQEQEWEEEMNVNKFSRVEAFSIFPCRFKKKQMPARKEHKTTVFVMGKETLSRPKN